MKDVVDAFAGRFYSGFVLEVHLLEVDGTADVGEVVEIPGGEIIDAAHVVSLLDERMGQGRADESGDSGDEITGHLSSAQTYRAGLFKSVSRLGSFSYYQGSQAESECKLRTGHMI